ncbi:MAG: Bax inhibitor-1 family protein, partial [Bacillota bacterium]|nr:Bax inhibitor-1 family protein [Bacillota bacterium]
GVAVFLGLTAYDVQKIKKYYGAFAGTPKEDNIAIFGALNLYLDFINLFLFILRILGRRR